MYAYKYIINVTWTATQIAVPYGLVPTHMQSLFKRVLSLGHTENTIYLFFGICFGLGMNESHCFLCSFLSIVGHLYINCRFTVPLVSRVCPSDVCRIWKSGSNLRVDATLLGFENMTWIRGRRSYIFRGDGNITLLHKKFHSVISIRTIAVKCLNLLTVFFTDSCAELMEVNHDDQVVDTERFNISQEMEEVTLESMQPPEQEVAKRLTTAIVNTYLDTKDIAFERQESTCINLISFNQPTDSTVKARFMKLDNHEF